VRDAAREAADRLHLLRLPEPRLGLGGLRVRLEPGELGGGARDEDVEEDARPVQPRKLGVVHEGEDAENASVGDRQRMNAEGLGARVAQDLVVRELRGEVRPGEPERRSAQGGIRARAAEEGKGEPRGLPPAARDGDRLQPVPPRRLEPRDEHEVRAHDDAEALGQGAEELVAGAAGHAGGHARQRLLLLAPRGHVAQDREMPSREHARARAHLDVARRAVGPAQPGEPVAEPFVHHAQERGARAGPVGLGVEVADLAADDLLALPAEEGAGGRVRVHERALVVGDEDRVRRVVEERAEDRLPERELLHAGQLEELRVLGEDPGVRAVEVEAHGLQRRGEASELVGALAPDLGLEVAAAERFGLPREPGERIHHRAPQSQQEQRADEDDGPEGDPRRRPGVGRGGVHLLRDRLQPDGPERTTRSAGDRQSQRKPVSRP
jgi:hypothetical protein